MTIKRIGTSPIVAFAVGNEQGADDYLDFATTNNPDRDENDVPAPWYPDDAVDANGQRIVAYIGIGTPGIYADIPGEAAVREAANGVLGLGIDRLIEDD